MKKYILQIKESAIAKNIATLVSGNIIGYAINTFLLLFIIRVYSPAEIGTYDLIVSDGAIITTVVGLGLVMAILIPKDDRTAKMLCQIVSVFSIISMIIGSIVLIAISGRFKLFSLNFNYSLACILLAIYSYFFIQQQLFYAYVNRKGLYRVLFWNPIIMAASNSGISLVLGLMGWSSPGYLIGTICSLMLSILLLMKNANPYNERFPISELKGTLSIYKEFPLVQMPANVVSISSQQIPIQYLGNVFSKATLGGFTMANRILSIPIALISTQISKVYQRELAIRNGRGERVGDFALDLLRKNYFLAFIAIFVLVVFGEPVVGIALGNKWRVSAIYMTILGADYLLKYCTSCISGTFVIVDRPRMSLLLSILTLAINVMCFVIVGRLGYGIFKTIIFYAVSDGVINLLNIFLCMKVINADYKKLMRFLFIEMLGSISVMYIIYILIDKIFYH